MNSGSKESLDLGVAVVVRYVEGRRPPETLNPSSAEYADAGDPEEVLFVNVDGDPILEKLIEDHWDEIEGAICERLRR